jgi:23S rRNA pseudouridine1911/1915/1917 synthase
VALGDATHLVTAAHAGCRLDRFLRSVSPGATWSLVRQAIESGKVAMDGEPCPDPSRPVPEGATVTVRMRAPRPAARSRLARDAIAHLDAQVVVVRKPSGISTVPYDRSERDTLDRLVRDRLGRRAPLYVVHRIDKETTGLVVFARTLLAKRSLDRQFRLHTLERRYLAIASGEVTSRTLQSRLVADRGDGRRGVTRHPTLGQAAVTHVTALEAAPGATLIECRLETGRTHQIRIHLAEAGHPLLGDRVYAPASRIAELGAPRVMLHATVLGFEHPVTGQVLRLEDPMPEDMRAVWDSLSGQRHQ